MLADTRVTAGSAVPECSTRRCVTVSVVPDSSTGCSGVSMDHAISRPPGAGPVSDNAVPGAAVAVT